MHFLVWTTLPLDATSGYQVLKKTNRPWRIVSACTVTIEPSQNWSLAHTTENMDHHYHVHPGCLLGFDYVHK